MHMFCSVLVCCRALNNITVLGVIIIVFMFVRVFTFVSECVIERNEARARGEKRKKRRARGDNERKKEMESVCTR